MRKTFTDRAWTDYERWLSVDTKVLARINKLIKDIERNGLLDGIGKPEHLKGCNEYSRRIDEKNRLVYTQDENGTLIILACKGHYED
ncbi:MAG: Txe/YoeB family addiction module toxin [Firmicutes bacterium]|nr:Txe/YoeB family addiction module toxin [Bacillota bacterium]